MTRHLLLIALWGASALVTVHAADITPEQQAKIEARCAAKPEACERIKSRIQTLKAKCDADPAKCEAAKEKLRARGAELKAQCEADPAQCEAKKAELKQRLQDRLAK